MITMKVLALNINFEEALLSPSQLLVEHALVPHLKIFVLYINFLQNIPHKMAGHGYHQER